MDDKLSWILSTGVVKQVGDSEFLVGKLTLEEMSNQQEEVYMDVKYLMDERNYIYLTETQYSYLTVE